jgi:hypothetical protein
MVNGVVVIVLSWVSSMKNRFNLTKVLSRVINHGSLHIDLDFLNRVLGDTVFFWPFLYTKRCAYL